MTDDEVTMLSIPDLARPWDCSRNFIWACCRSGEIPSTKIGGKWLIPVWWVKKQVQRGMVDGETKNVPYACGVRDCDSRKFRVVVVADCSANAEFYSCKLHTDKQLVPIRLN